MSSTATSGAAVVSPAERVEVLFEELAELAGQRNAIDGRIVEIVAELDRDGLWGVTGAQRGNSGNRRATVAIVWALPDEQPIFQATNPATVNQLRTALKLEPRPEPEPDFRPEPRPSITRSADEQFSCWRIKLPHVEAAKFDAALQSHLDALIAEYKRDHDNSDGVSDQRPPLPGNVEAFLRLVEAGWDAEVARRPHGQHTTVVMHLDVQERAAGLHLGPLLSESERRYLLCDATFEAWFERDGQVIGCGRTTRQINRRLRRALEHRDRTCVVPGCGATRGLHAHHIRHWQDGGATELANLVLVCPYHHRAHHRGLITITGPADNLTVADSAGRPLSAGSLARASTKPPPAVAPWPGPTGERADWWWYEPFQPQPPPISN